jgi:GNAT superfamily N-acetyltransferase
MPGIFLADHSLACRLERAEAVSNARFVEARRRVFPASGAEWIEVAGACAMFDGADSPCTQTFGLGLWQMPEGVDMDRIEMFFADRGAPVLHEVSPLSDKRLLPMLAERGYHPIELSHVMYLPLAALAADPVPADSPRVRVADPGERGLWGRTMVEGWSDVPEVAPVLGPLMRVAVAEPDNVAFLAEIEGRVVAAGALRVHDRVALLAGASTAPAWRRRGAQRALLQTRLEYAAHVGCDLAMIGAEPGSESARNAQRHGFRIAYTRIKWRLVRT